MLGWSNAGSSMAKERRGKQVPPPVLTCHDMRKVRGLFGKVQW